MLLRVVYSFVSIAATGLADSEGIKMSRGNRTDDNIIQ